jgi:hypothetical protein
MGVACVTPVSSSLCYLGEQLRVRRLVDPGSGKCSSLTRDNRDDSALLTNFGDAMKHLLASASAATAFIFEATFERVESIHVER